MKIQIWKGFQRVVLDDEFASGEFIEFDGEKLGTAWEGEDARGAQLVFYRTSDGRIIVYKTRWFKWQGEDRHASVYVFSSLDEATAAFRSGLEYAGIIPRQTLTLDEVDGR